MKEDNPRVRLPPPLIILAGLAFGLLLDGRLVNPHLNLTVLLLRETACAFIGLPLRISALGLFHRKGTRSEPWKPSSALVTSGV